jgi:hypothetical protein
MAQTLATEYGEIVPGNLDELVTSPGQGFGELLPFLWAGTEKMDDKLFQFGTSRRLFVAEALSGGKDEQGEEQD